MYDACVCVEYVGDFPEFFSPKMVTARKDHVCCECGDAIKKGEKHEYVVGKWEGEFDYFRTCQTCKNIREDLFQCGWTYGNMWEDIREAFADALSIDEEDDFEWLK